MEIILAKGRCGHYLYDPIEINVGKICFLCLENHIWFENEISEENNMVLKRQVKETIRIDKGTYKGTFTRVAERKVTSSKSSETFTYIDYYLKLDGKEIELKVSLPEYVSAESKTGKFLTKFGQVVEAGKDVDFEALVGKRAEFYIVKEKGDDGNEYARISLDTVEPTQ